METKVKSKYEVVTAVAETTNVSKRVVEVVMNSVISEIRKSLENGLSVRLPELGTFMITSRKECFTINPRTREKIVTPPVLIPRLKFNKSIGKKLNE